MGMEKPVSLLGIHSAFGERVIKNAEIEEKYGLPAGWVLDKTKKEKGHAWDNGPEAPTLAALRCLDRLLAEAGIDRARIKSVFGTTNPIGTEAENTESLTQIFAHRAGLDEGVKVSDEGFGCGGAAIGVDSMCRWFQDQPEGTYAIYVTQDWPTKMVEDRNVEALFSDAVSVSLWTNGPDGLMEVTDTFSIESTIADQHLRIDGGVWKMEGKGVAESASQVPALVAEKLGIDLQDYDIVPHQPNAKLLETIEGIYDIELHKRVAREHGNPTCSGAFIALQYALEDRKKGIGTNVDKDILVMPFGAGGVGGFILRKKNVSAT